MGSLFFSRLSFFFRSYQRYRSNRQVEARLTHKITGEYRVYIYNFIFIQELRVHIDMS